MKIGSKGAFVTAAVILAGAAHAEQFHECVLKNAPTIQTSSGEAIDVIYNSCIKLSEQDLAEQAAKLTFAFSYGQMQMVQADLGLIVDVYNGSDFDITSMTLALTDKTTNTRRLYKQDLWIQYFSNSIPKVWPEFRWRFIKAQTRGVYIVPLGKLEGDTEFFKRYVINVISVRGIK